MKIVPFTASTKVESGEVRTAEGAVELYESVRELQEMVTVEHFNLLNAKILEVAQTSLRNTLKDETIEQKAKRQLSELKKSNPEEYKAKLRKLAELMGL